MSRLIRRQTFQANGLVLNIVNECNLHCPFCYSRANERAQAPLTIEQIERILGLHRGKIVYLSGGEPTVHPALFSIAAFIKRKGFRVGLFTNGKNLSRKEYVVALKKSGVDFVILQFDTLDDADYKVLRGEPLLGLKIAAVNNLKESGIPLYLFVMLTGEAGMAQIGSLIDFVKSNTHIKIINFNPVWEIGRLGTFSSLPTSEIVHRICSQTGLTLGDFLEGTEFSFLLSEILRKLGFVRTNIQPLCELRCYILFSKGKAVPLTEILDLTSLNVIFEKAAAAGNRVVCAVRLLPLLFLCIRQFFQNKYARSAFFLLLRNYLARAFGASFLGVSPFVSIIVGTFQTAEQLDFNTLRTCNLYSDYPSGEYIFSACIRQILLERPGNRLADTEKLVQSYRACLDGGFK